MRPVEDICSSSTVLCENVIGVNTDVCAHICAITHMDVLASTLTLKLILSFLFLIVPCLICCWKRKFEDLWKSSEEKSM